jgi:hypothetical protein
MAVHGSARLRRRRGNRTGGLTGVWGYAYGYGNRRCSRLTNPLCCRLMGYHHKPPRGLVAWGALSRFQN